MTKPLRFISDAGDLTPFRGLFYSHSHNTILFQLLPSFVHLFSSLLFSSLLFSSLFFSSLIFFFFLSFLILLYISMICNDIKDRRLKLYRHKSLHITSYHLLFHIFSYHIYRVILPTFCTSFRCFRGDCSTISEFNNY